MWFRSASKDSTLKSCSMRQASFAAVFSGSDEEGYKYVICSNKVDVSVLGKDFNRALNGRGGGKNPMIQGSVQASREEIRKYFADRP